MKKYLFVMLTLVFTSLNSNAQIDPRYYVSVDVIVLGSAQPCDIDAEVTYCWKDEADENSTWRTKPWVMKPSVNILDPVGEGFQPDGG